MYLSKIEVDLNKPKARTWITNWYRIHQRLLMAFEDNIESRLLFRVEDSFLPPRILVQSHLKPDWKKAFLDFDVLNGEISTSISVREFDPIIAYGSSLQFSILANPTKRSASNGKRIPLRNEEEIYSWFARKGEQGGFNVRADTLYIRINHYSTSEKNPQKFKNGITHHSVNLNGILIVKDEVKFQQTLRSGIGSGKAFGFGMLSIAPVR